MKRKTSQISLRLDPELFDAIDRARGQVPRERWVRELVIAAVALSDTPVPNLATGRPERLPAAPHRPVLPTASQSPSLERFRQAQKSGRPPKGGKS